MFATLSKFLNSKSQKISSAALTVAVFGLISRLFGLFRDRMLAGQFGAGQTLDIYYAAFKIPDLLYSFLIAGSIAAAFLPVFHEYFTKDKDEAWRVSNLTLNFLFLALVILSLVLVVFAPQLIFLIAPGFDVQARAVTVDISRMMFLSTLFLGLSSLISALLQAFSRFLITSLAPIFYNLGIIFGILFLVPTFGIKGLAYGVIIGAAAHFLIQIPALFNVGFRWQPILDFKDPGIKKVAKLWIPTLGLAALQLNTIVITSIASLLTVGSIAIFNLADNLRSVPMGIIGVAFSTAAFPAMSLAYAQGKKDLFLKRFSLAVRQTLFIAIPVSLFFFVLRAHIVRIILGTGQFSWQDTRLTAAALGIFAFGIFASTLIPLFTRAFYVFHNTKTPVIINVVSMVVNIILSFLFVGALLKFSYLNNILARILRISDLGEVAVLGLPLAVTVATVINFSWHWIGLKKSVSDFGIAEIKKSFWRIICASIAGIIFTYIGLYLFSGVFNNKTLIGLLLQTSTAFLIGAAAYLVLAHMMRMEEILMFNITGTLFNWRGTNPEPRPAGDTLDDQY
jgi:putative peptidoglycan lipid II flippase